MFKFVYPDEYAVTHRGTTKAAIDVEQGINSDIKRHLKRSFFVDALSFFCNSGECLFRQGDDYLFSDYGHYSHSGSMMAVKAILEVSSTNTKDF